MFWSKRGSFRPVCHVNIDMLRCARENCLRATLRRTDGGEVVELMELDYAQPARGRRRHRPGPTFWPAPTCLAASGKIVLISDYFEYYRASAFLAEHTKNRIANHDGGLQACASCSTSSTTHPQLPGGILESFGRLFKNELRLYIYPLLDQITGSLITVDNLEIASRLRKALWLPVDSGFIKQTRERQPRLPAHLPPRDGPFARSAPAIRAGRRWSRPRSPR